MRKINIALIIMVSAFIISCESNTYNEVSIAATNPTYTSNVQAVIKANCIGCHASGSQFPNLETYAQVKESTQSGSLICRIDQSISCGAIMPPNGALSKQTIDMIKLWQTQGYAN